MINNFETNFISETKEKTKFSDAAVQSFFTEYCRVNDSITPKFISREDWQQRDIHRILEKSNNNEQTLFIPTDLHLWEMIDIIKSVDYETFARKPELREQKANKIKKLGIIFEKAGLYLKEYSSILDKDSGKEIEENIAHEFYQYGISLQNKKQYSDEVLAKTMLTKISPKDKQEIDEWFLGKDVYQKRMERLGENSTPEQIEERRKKLIKVYFKALTIDGHRAEGEKIQEVIKGPAQHLQDENRTRIIRAIETPSTEMQEAIFRRGIEKLITEMKEAGWRKKTNNLLKKLGFDALFKQRKLYDVLQIHKLKAELKDLKETRDVIKISIEELKIAKKIQKAVSGFPYKTGKNNPSEMIETQFINCLGASILGGSLLDEVGIKYLYADLLMHSATILVTSDGKAYWQDFTPGNLKQNYTEITNNMLKKPVNIADFSKKLNNQELFINFKEWNPYKHIKKDLIVNLSNPEIGLQSSILYNIGYALFRLGKYKEVIEAYKQAIKINPEDITSYNGLGNALNYLGKYKEAIDVYKQAIKIDPEFSNPYVGLRNSLRNLNKQRKHY